MGFIFAALMMYEKIINHYCKVSLVESYCLSAVYGLPSLSSYCLAFPSNFPTQPQAPLTLSCGISFKGSRPALVSISYSRGREDGAVKGGRKRLFKGSGLKQWESDLNTPHTLKDISSHSFSLTLSRSLSFSLPVSRFSLTPSFS